MAEVKNKSDEAKTKKIPSKPTESQAVACRRAKEAGKWNSLPFA